MDDIKKIYAFIISAPVIIIIFIIALVIMIADGSNGDPSAVAVGNLSEFNTPLLPFLELEMIHLQMKKYFIVVLTYQLPKVLKLWHQQVEKYIKQDMNLMV